MSVGLQRDPGGIDEILRTCSPSLRRFFLKRVRCSADVDDLVQDVCFRLIRRGDITDVAHIQAFIFQTAANVWRDYLRRCVTHDVLMHDEPDETLEDDNASPERVLIGKDDVSAFNRAMLDLPERTRAIFIMSRIEEMDYRAIAAQQEISISAVEKHIAKALAHLTRSIGS